MIAIMDHVTAFVEAFKAQTQLASGLSTAAIGAILFSWTRLFRVIDSKDMQNFRRAGLLGIPLLLLIVAVILGYVLSATITGYYYEILVDWSYDTQTAAGDPVKHFNDGYVVMLNGLGLGQLGCSVAGMILVAGWYAWNVLSPTGRVQEGESEN